MLRQISLILYCFFVGTHSLSDGGLCDHSDSSSSPCLDDDVTAFLQTEAVVKIRAAESTSLKTCVADAHTETSRFGLLALASAVGLFALTRLPKVQYGDPIKASKCFVQIAPTVAAEIASSTKPVTPKREQVIDILEAASRGDADAALAALQSGSRVNVTDDWGCTALHIAAARGSLHVVEVLVDFDADLNAVDAWDETPLHMGARSGQYEVCQFLIKSGANVNAVDADDKTPLMQAAQTGHTKICDLLLDSGGGVGFASDDEIPAVLSVLLTTRCIRRGTGIMTTG